ncbi:uncharacterized protein LOC136043870 [Artemia franciscana]|uniref:uncharacterized protein LOC136043870 n=1 Tax=Artemia franciscana TaxID=6661 RepID=UPI0032DBC9B2
MAVENTSFLSVALLSLLALHAVALPIDDDKPIQRQQIKKVSPPKIKYSAVENIVRLDFGEGIYKYGYKTDDHYKTEERKSDGSVSGYYGFTEKDGRPVRVKYSASSSLGFQTKREVFSKEFATVDGSPLANENRRKKQFSIITENDDKDSISVDSIDVASRVKRQNVVLERNPGEPDILIAAPRIISLRTQAGFVAGASNPRRKASDETLCCI